MLTVNYICLVVTNKPIVLSVIMLNVISLSVVALYFGRHVTLSMMALIMNVSNVFLYVLLC
jgi:hypothetical protein